MSDALGVGHRVILADATTRAPDVLGTVIEPDPYTDRDAVLRVGFENGTARWVSDDRLVRFGGPCAAEVLAEWNTGAAWRRRHHGVDAVSDADVQAEQTPAADAERWVEAVIAVRIPSEDVASTDPDAEKARRPPSVSTTSWTASAMDGSPSSPPTRTGRPPSMSDSIPRSGPLDYRQPIDPFMLRAADRLYTAVERQINDTKRIDARSEIGDAALDYAQMRWPENTSEPSAVTDEFVQRLTADLLGEQVAVVSRFNEPLRERYMADLHQHVRDAVQRALTPAATDQPQQDPG